MENQQFKITNNGNEITCIANNNLDDVSVAFIINNVTYTYDVLGYSNARESKNIIVHYRRTLTDTSNKVLEQETLRYNVTVISMYEGLFNGLPIAGLYRGQDSYLHALNGVIRRITEIGGIEDGTGGHEPFDETTGELKAEYIIE